MKCKVQAPNVRTIYEVRNHFNASTSLLAKLWPRLWAKSENAPFSRNRVRSHLSALDQPHDQVDIHEVRSDITPSHCSSPKSVDNSPVTVKLSITHTPIRARKENRQGKHKPDFQTNSWVSFRQQNLTSISSEMRVGEPFPDRRN